MVLSKEFVMLEMSSTNLELRSKSDKEINNLIPGKETENHYGPQMHERDRSQKPSLGNDLR